MLWFGLSILLLVLGINKQLDLQTLLTALGREIAQENGLYESRREIQLIFVILFALFCFSSLAFARMPRAEARGGHAAQAPALRDGDRRPRRSS